MPVPAQMPFADAGSCITTSFQHSRYGRTIRLDKRLVIPKQNSFLQRRTPVIASGQNTIASRRTDRRARMGVCKTNSFRSHLVQMTCPDLASGIIRRDITYTQIIGQNKNNIRLLFRRCHRRQSAQCSQRT